MIPYLASFLLVASAWTVGAAPIKLVSQDYASGTIIYDAGEARYMTPFTTAYATITGKKLSVGSNTPSVGLWFNSTGPITKEAIKEQLKQYYALDDVLSAAFLSSVLLSSSATTALSKDAIAYFEELGLEHLFVDPSIKSVPSSTTIKTTKVTFSYKKYDAIEGPFIATPSEDGISFFPVYRLYVDEFRDFVL
jgi:hypothetical protein